MGTPISHSASSLNGCNRLRSRARRMWRKRCGVQRTSHRARFALQPAQMPWHRWSSAEHCLKCLRGDGRRSLSGYQLYRSSTAGACNASAICKKPGPPVHGQLRQPYWQIFFLYGLQLGQFVSMYGSCF